MDDDEKAQIIRGFVSKRAKIEQRERLTSLGLQAFLHFNVYFMPVLLIFGVSCFVVKYSLLSVTYQVLLISIFIVFCIVECVRLLLGYYGNLGEKIPALSGFWITSLLIQLPLSLFLLFNADIRPLPLEKAVYGIHIIFLIGEAVTGFDVMRRIANHQMINFQKRIEQEEIETNEKEQK
ncbi:unnamed protein product, partial [Mesorhabditis belari]|uniref:Transmembrane protein 17 n=1 Tax=Mesorhabditis belari TaxID=2138241 RepID=A0AAF3EHT9_9BILA